LKKPSEPNKSFFLATAFSVVLGGLVLFFHFMPLNLAIVKKEPWVQRLSVSQAPVLAESTSAIPPESLPGASQLALGQRIDLNRVGVSDLAALPGIGLKMAETIIRDREERGPFRSIEDLMRVKGIKEKKFSQIQPFIKVERL
jgi:competence ComEA-like helix-hairpin-helix protein